MGVWIFTIPNQQTTEPPAALLLLSPGAWLNLKHVPRASPIAAIDFPIAPLLWRQELRQKFQLASGVVVSVLVLVPHRYRKARYLGSMISKRRDGGPCPPIGRHRYFH